jgi:hypothetical protein
MLLGEEMPAPFNEDLASLESLAAFLLLKVLNAADID